MKIATETTLEAKQASHATDVPLAGQKSVEKIRAAPRRKIRVLHLLTSEVRGGIEEGVFSLLRRLDRRRFSPSLACPPALLAACRRELQGLDITVHALPSLSRPYQLVSMARLARIVRTVAPDVLHTHLFVASLCAAPLAKLCGVPVVVESCRIREGWRRGIWKSYRIDGWINRFVDANIAISESLRRYLLQEKRFPPEKVVLIRNARDLTRVLAPPERDVVALRSEFGVRPGELVVSVPGRLEVQKGHRYLLEALPSVLRRFPDLRVLIVGSGSLHHQLAAEIDRRKLKEHVVLAGYREDVYDIMRLSDLVVLPSLYEGLPLVAVEAGALGKPIVATAVDGTPEVVLDRETGWLVPPGNCSELAKAMCELLGNSNLRRRWGERAREHVLSEFSFDLFVTETERLYTRLCTPPVN